ncbi:MAG: hypothetical protein LBO79_06540 [Zoogloeaceae bacterium]|jgi:type IV pilus assembly protein PilX|nr:hypothetical protein [Zoogloeaceae bacterium]
MREEMVMDGNRKNTWRKTPEGKRAMPRFSANSRNAFPGIRPSPRSVLSRQRGAALVVGLVMLIIVTLLSLAAMQSVRQQERIAGNASEYSGVFSKTETALRGVENCVNGHFTEYPAARVNEQFDENFGVDEFPLDPESPQSWIAWKKQTFRKNCNSAGDVNLDTLYGLLAGVDPWVVVEQLPSVQSDESLQTEKKRDTEVFRITTLGSNRDPTSADATVVVILQSILWR